MKRSLLLALSLSVALASTAYAQTGTRKVVPTIPESQIGALQLESPYIFLSAATSVDEFMVATGNLAAAKGMSDTVKATAADMVAIHMDLMRQSIEAARTDGVEIAKPSVDGEQQGILNKLEGVDGEEFDRTYIEALVFGHQRAIGIYRGYADKGDALGAFAAATLPQVIARYAEVVKLADAQGGDAATPQAPAVQN